MIAELRRFTISPGRSEALFAQFEELSRPLLIEHGITVHGPWSRRLTQGEQLVYILEFEDEADREKRWTAFRTDSRWVSAQAELTETPYVAGLETIELTR